MKRGILFLILSAFFLNVMPLAFAQVKIDKTEINLTIKPAGKIVDSITLQNSSNKDILVKAYFEDWAYIPPFEGQKEARPLGSTPWSLGKWASVTPGEFILPASGKFSVVYTINVPEDAEGGYYGILFFERSSMAPKTTGIGREVGISLKVRTGPLFFLETKNKKKRLRIGGILVVKEGMQGSLLNTGNVLLTSKISSYIMNAKGMVVKRAEHQRYVPPGEEAFFTVNLPGDLSPGAYTLLINYDFKEGKPLVKEVDFTKGDTGEIKILRQKD
jgi:hypothetical protein